MARAPSGQSERIYNASFDYLQVGPGRRGMKGVDRITGADLVIGLITLALLAFIALITP